jgi:amidase
VETRIVDLTARQLADQLHRKQLSAREVVQAHLDRIETVNPRINAIVTLTAEQALEAAAHADEQLAARRPVGRLHGIPMAHKDTHETAGIRTTYGSPLLGDHVPDQDELIIERLHAAGAITLGKTNVPEFAAGSHTINPVFGPTRNPYDPTRSAGGSSGGAAAALATGMHPLADGSDLGGSLRNPASFCNVVGLRPTPGRVPSWPALLGWDTLGVQGPMARTVADAAFVLSVLAGPDPRSPIAQETAGDAFSTPLDVDPQTLRVAWSPDLGGALPVTSDVRQVVEAAAGVFGDLGAAVDRDCIDFAGADEIFRTLRAWQFALIHGERVADHRDQLKPSLIDNIEQGLRLTGADVARAQMLRTQLYHRTREFFGRYDVLLLPVSQLPPFPIEWEYPTEIDGTAMADYLDWMRSAYYVTVTGSPALSVPAGFTAAGLPVGVQLVGPHGDDLGVLRAGSVFERATGYADRRPEIVE